MHHIKMEMRQRKIQRPPCANGPLQAQVNFLSRNRFRNKAFSNLLLACAVASQTPTKILFLDRRRVLFTIIVLFIYTFFVYCHCRRCCCCCVFFFFICLMCMFVRLFQRAPLHLRSFFYAILFVVVILKLSLK